ncbi:type VI secretion system baseplate subunit TssG [Acanthopleuribacter pedis]|uniref:Type VI secretion system baseplate subunit TssG n=1 Tax=Acanthopleuribacter pedis TaxID=442870 RepID=A0A8J7U4W5_9BACT|nr:type VI secretion system baseplate subunit TssG [Acanthopleuribacter pedis]MBO1321077.1 type VI secretion system baseplate subunit TssG [Acanthopleuribacter pedis]
MTTSMPAVALEQCAFLQLIRLLENAERDRPAVGDTPEPNREVVRFRGRVDFGFPGAQVDQLEATGAAVGEGPAYVLTSRVLTLLGRFGPMPSVYSERIMRRLSEGDEAGREFLDVFHHRLVTLWIKICKAIQPELNAVPAAESDYLRQLFAFAGLGLDSFKDPFGPVDTALLGGVGLPTRVRIPAEDLARLVRFHFGVTCRVKPFVGGPLTVSREDRAVLSARHGARLGCSGALGKRAWDCNSRFAVCLENLSLARLADFCPGGADYAALVRLLRFHSGADLDFRLELQIAPLQPRGALLTASEGTGGAALGWNTLLAASAPLTPAVVTLYPDRIAPTDGVFDTEEDVCL